MKIRKKLPILTLLVFLFLANNVMAQMNIKVMNYNVLNYPSSSSSLDPRNADFATIVQYVGADIIVISELKSSAGADDLLSTLNTNGITYYDRAPNYFNFGGTALGNMLFFNSNKLGLAKHTQIYSSPREHSDYKLYVKEPNLACHQDTAFLHCIGLHLKASSGGTNPGRRLTGIQDLMTYLDGLPATENVMVMGDFNFYSNDFTNTSNNYYEPAYGELIDNSYVHTMIDVIPTWTRNNSGFVDLFTQSTRSSAYPGGNGGSTGGMDDRFDFQFMNSNVLNGTNRITYTPNSYTAFGNDGYHFNDAFIDPSVSVPSGTLNNVVPDIIAQALFDMSDHLPVITEVTATYAPSGNVSGLASTNIMDNAADLSWSNVTTAASYNVQYRPTGSGAWTNASSASNTMTLTGLSACTDYEFQVQVVCANGGTGAYSSSSTFVTSVMIPNIVNTNNITATTAELSWNASPSTGNIYCNIEYREIGTGTWLLIPNILNSPFTLTSLNPCTDYEYKIETICNTSGFSAGFTPMTTFSTTNCTAQLQVKVLLEGAYLSGGLMSNNMKTNNLIPTTQPYSASPWNYGGTESVASTSIPSTTTDWILIEIRDAATGAIVEQQAALLQTNGNVLEANTLTSNLSFPNLVIGNSYNVVVRHRNHLAAISSSSFTAIAGTSFYDFTNGMSQAFGPNQQTSVPGGMFALHAGDINSDGIINVADLNFYNGELSSTSGYFASDINLNGSVLIGDFNQYRPNASIIGVQQIRY